jgi:hypothetical protein
MRKQLLVIRHCPHPKPTLQEYYTTPIFKHTGHFLTVSTCYDDAASGRAPQQWSGDATDSSRAQAKEILTGFQTQ